MSCDTIILKTKVKAPENILPLRTIKKKNSLLSRVFQKKPKYEEFDVLCPIETRPVEVIINDEIDAKSWMLECYNPDIPKILAADYKKTVVIMDFDDNSYALHGAFPVEVAENTNIVTLCYDYLLDYPANTLPSRRIY